MNECLSVEPPSGTKRRASSSTEESSKSTEVASESVQRAREQTPVLSTINLFNEFTVRPISDLPRHNTAPRDPFHDPSCVDDDVDTSSTTTKTSPPDMSFALFHSPAPVPDPDIPSGDLPYFNFFLEEMCNILPYVNIFPSAPSSLFSSSLHHPALRHSILSISALISDKKSSKGKQRALEHLQKSLKLLQTSLSAAEVDEGVAISVFLLAYFDISCGDLPSAQKHLQGLCMVLAQLQQEHLVRNGGVLSPYAISPLTMLVWRMAIRMDFILAIMYGRRPVFPMYENDIACADSSIAEDQEEFHRIWITLFADRNQGPSASEWALAWFALDNTMHRACHVSADAILLCRSRKPQEGIEIRIQKAVDLLLAGHRKWRRRTVVREADEMEQRGQLLSMFTNRSTTICPLDISSILPTSQPPSQKVEETQLQFLQYPPLTLTNSFYANLLNHYRSIEIYISLILRPMWETLDPWRFKCAIDLCRTHAALGEERNFLTTGKIWGLYLAGVTFGGPKLYPVCSIIGGCG